MVITDQPPYPVPQFTVYFSSPPDGIMHADLSTSGLHGPTHPDPDTNTGLSNAHAQYESDHTILNPPVLQQDPTGQPPETSRHAHRAVGDAEGDFFSF